MDSIINMYDVLLSKDAPGPDKELITDLLRKEIDRALNKLTRREADIARLYFGLNDKRAHRLEEIAELFHLTKKGLCRSEKRRSKD